MQSRRTEHWCDQHPQASDHHSLDVLQGQCCTSEGGRQLRHEHCQAHEHDTVAASQGQHYLVEAAHLVVADGASSPLRRGLGIQMQGDAALQHLVNIHFNCPSIWRLVAKRPAMLYFVFSSEVIAVLVAHNLKEGELVAQVRC